MNEYIYDVAIVGGGAGGMSSALYMKRAGLNPIIIERGLLGGQMNNTGTIENYIGVGNITGQDLSKSMAEQIKDNDIDIININIKRVLKSDDGHFVLKGTKKEIIAKTIVLATGVKHKELGVDGEQECQGGGVSYCAICDGFFFKDKDVTVIGGGDSAFEEGAFLADIAKSVELIYYKDFTQIKAKPELVYKFLSKGNTNVLDNTNVVSIEKDSKNDKLLLYKKNKKDEIAYIESTDGVFIYVGVLPVNEIAKDINLEMDINGYVLVNNKFQTSIDGVFAIGDLIRPDMKQIALAVADGAVVSKYVKEYLENES